MQANMLEYYISKALLPLAIETPCRNHGKPQPTRYSMISLYKCIKYVLSVAQAMGSNTVQQYLSANVVPAAGLDVIGHWDNNCLH